MHYHWGGDVIFRDTVVPDKRFVIGSPTQPVATDIREWLQPDNAESKSLVLAHTVERIPGLPQSKRPGDYDRRAHAIWAFVARHVRYNLDKDRRGYDDFWLFAEETLSLCVGDCEDSSILMAALMIIGTAAVLIGPEPPNVSVPRTLRAAVVEPFRAFFQGRWAYAVLAFIILYKLPDALAGAMTTPFLLDLQYSKTEIGAVNKGFGLFSTLCGALLGGAWIARYGIYRCLWGFGFAQAFSNLAFGLLALGP